MDGGSENRSVLRTTVSMLIVLFITALLVVIIEAVSMAALRSRGESRPFLLQSRETDVVQVASRADTSILSFIDPHLSHAHDPESMFALGELPGFAVYGDLNAPREEVIRIVALGGSTTEPSSTQCWPQKLYEELTKRGYSCLVLNGGVAGYSTNQELFKFIRDVMPLNPDIVISLSGVNDLGYGHSLTRPAIENVSC